VGPTQIRVRTSRIAIHYAQKLRVASHLSRSGPKVIAADNAQFWANFRIFIDKKLLRNSVPDTSANFGHSVMWKIGRATPNMAFRITKLIKHMNFFASGPKDSPNFYRQTQEVVSFSIVSAIRSRYIHDRSLKSSEITPNFEWFLPLNFSGAGPKVFPKICTKFGLLPCGILRKNVWAVQSKNVQNQYPIYIVLLKKFLKNLMIFSRNA